jgi:predicted nuclease with TOPRIM domain
MKNKHLPGMRDIPTIQGLRNRAVPSSREQVVSELARLEHEKARLERELNMWLTNQKKTQERIQQVQERVNLLQHVLDDISPKRQPTSSPSSGEQTSEEEEQKVGKYREVPLEY